MPAALANAATQATTANKPIIAAGPTPLFNAFSFDGTNDSLATASIAASTSECAVLSGVFPVLSGNNDAFNRYPGSNTGGIIGRVDATGSAITIIHDGTAFRTAASPTGAVVANVPVTITFVKGASRTYTRINGVEVATAAFAAGAQGASLPLTIGTSAVFANMRLLSFNWLPAEPTAAEFAILERAAGICSGQVTS
jgi:hypothetical protein